MINDISILVSSIIYHIYHLNMDEISKLESILFVASKPLALEKIAKVLKLKTNQVEEFLIALEQKYTGVSGVHIDRTGGYVQMVSNPQNVEVVEKFVKNEVQGELTKAQLETLTVVAYRGPITRPELEEIRGVNCAVILRNLAVRGLVVETSQKDSILDLYELSIDALRHLGIQTLSELPDYEGLHEHAHLEFSLDNSDKS